VDACRDTAGQERYESLAPLYYRGAQAAAVVYDVSNAGSFQRAQHWVGELRRHTSGGSGSGSSAAASGGRPAGSGQGAPALQVLVLVGNKADLPAEERAVTAEEAAALAQRCAGCLRGRPAGWRAGFPGQGAWPREQCIEL